MQGQPNSDFPLAQQSFRACHLLCWQDPQKEYQQQDSDCNIVFWIFIQFSSSQLVLIISAIDLASLNFPLTALQQGSRQKQDTETKTDAPEIASQNLSPFL